MNPKLPKNYNHARNSIPFQEISHGSNKKVWWQCELGHEWEQSPKGYSAASYDCPYCSNKQILVGFNDLSTLNPTLAKEWHPTKNPEGLLQSISSKSHTKVWWVCEEGHEWEARMDSRTGGNGCPVCSTRKANENKKTSAVTIKKPVAENKSVLPIEVLPKNNETIVEFLASVGVEIETNTTDVVPNFELDIYVPHSKVAIEYNGLYQHSEEQGKDKWYHHGKWKACKEKGIQLIQVWEDDWNRNPELVKRMLTHKLGVSKQRKVYARATQIMHLSDVDTRGYLEQYHIQGYTQGGVRVALVDNHTGDVVSLMVLKREPGTDGKTLNLLRFVTSQPVQGGFTKLLKYVEKTYSPESIVSFSDNTVSDGGLYENNGFVAVTQLSPDYTYLAKGVREHKFNYRLKRFRNDPELLWDESLTERELARLNNLPRIWDAGKTKWEKKF